MKIRWNSRYKTVCAYAVVTFTACLLITLFFVHIAEVGKGLSFLADVLMPFIIGFALAFLLNRPALFLERHMFGRMDHVRRPRLWRNLSILLLYLILFAIFLFLAWYIIPQLASSVGVLFQKLPGEIENLRQSVVGWAQSTAIFSDSMENSINTFFATFLDITGYLDRLFASSGNITAQVSAWVFKAVVGVIVSVYVLAGKQKLARQAGQIMRAVFPENFAIKLIETLRYTGEVFVQYVVGMLLDCLVVGGCTFVFLLLTGFPYPLLGAAIIGTTNIIPMFGPIIGAAACAAIIFVVNPVQALWFLVFIVALQQIDGNIIMPHIVGKTTRLQAFWVLFALILGGGLFGFWGLLLGVPVWAVLYSLIASTVHAKLQKKEKGAPPPKS